MLLLALAIAPGLAIILYIYRKDSYDKEPKRYLLASFFLGMLSTLPAIALESAAKVFLGETNAYSPISFYAFFAFIIVAGSEEGCKFFMVKWYAPSPQKPERRKGPLRFM